MVVPLYLCVCVCVYRIFGGLIADIKRKVPFFLSDFKDALHVQCVASFFFMYFACLSPIITFGGLLGAATGENIVSSAPDSLHSNLVWYNMLCRCVSVLKCALQRLGGCLNVCMCLYVVWVSDIICVDIWMCVCVCRKTYFCLNVCLCCLWQHLCLCLNVCLYVWQHLYGCLISSFLVFPTSCIKVQFPCYLLNYIYLYRYLSCWFAITLWPAVTKAGGWQNNYFSRFFSGADN